MPKHYKLTVMFMGHPLWVEMDPGVYGENERHVQERLEKLNKRFWEFLEERGYVRAGYEDFTV